LNDVVDATSSAPNKEDNVAEGDNQEREGAMDLQRATEEHCPSDNNEKSIDSVTNQESPPDMRNASTLEGGSDTSSGLDEGVASGLTYGATENRTPGEHGSEDDDDALITVPEKINETPGIEENDELSPQSQDTLVSAEASLPTGKTEAVEAIDILKGLPEAALDGPMSPLQFSDAGQAVYGERWWLNPSTNPLMPGEGANTKPAEIVSGLNGEYVDPTLPNGLTPAHVPGRAAVELNRRQFSEVPTIADKFGSGQKNLMIVASIVIAIITILLVR
jgi:hypothetical protein